MKIQLDEAAILRLKEHPDVQAETERRVDLAVQFAKKDCPVDTGRARDSIRKERDANGDWQVVGGGQGVDYFEYIEYGTRDTEAFHPLLHAAQVAREG